MSAFWRPLTVSIAAFVLTAAAPDTFSREELQALEAERQAAEQKLEALQAAGENTLSDLKNIDSQLISAAMESQRREEQASNAEKSLIDLGATNQLDPQFPDTDFSDFFWYPRSFLCLVGEFGGKK